MNLMRVKLGFVALLDDPQRQILPRLYGFLRDCGAQQALEFFRGCPVGQAFSPRQYRGTRDSHRDVLRRGDVLAGLHRGRYQTVARRVWALMVSDCVELRGIAPWTRVPRVSASLRPAHTGAIRQVGDQRILALVETSVCDAALQEAATYPAYRAQKDRAELEKDPTLEAIFFLVSRDEAAHAGFYREMIAIEMAEDRIGTLADLAHVIANFKMPGDGLIPNYHENLRIGGGGISPRLFFTRAVLPLLKQLGTSRDELKSASAAALPIRAAS